MKEGWTEKVCKGVKLAQLNLIKTVLDSSLYVFMKKKCALCSNLDTLLLIHKCIHLLELQWLMDFNDLVSFVLDRKMHDCSWLLFWNLLLFCKSILCLAVSDVGLISSCWWGLMCHCLFLKYFQLFSTHNQSNILSPAFLSLFKSSMSFTLSVDIGFLSRN